MKVYLSLKPEQVDEVTGVGQVVLAQYKYLPQYGVQFVDAPEDADVIACHISKGNLPRVDVTICHGLYWEDIPHTKFDSWHYSANRDIISSINESLEFTVPSRWVAEPFMREMRRTPWIIEHGIELDDWNPRKKTGGYILYNKNRESDVCTAIHAWELAQRGANVISTYAPVGKDIPDTMKVVGLRPHDEMKELIHNATIYLATTMETLGVGTLEALAAGVPVLGYNHGGTKHIIRHKIDGYLVEPGDIDGLVEGAKYIVDNREAMSDAARERASDFQWKNVIRKYLEVFEACISPLEKEKDNSYTVIVTNYNYGDYVPEAIDSALSQTVKPKEIIVVDDGSTDDSLNIIKKRYANNSGIRIISQENCGVAEARNRGVKESTTEYNICLDADDKIVPHFAKALLPEITKNRAIGVVYGGLMLMRENGEPWKKSDFPPQFDWKIQSNPTVPPSTAVPSPSCCIFRKSMWERSGGWKQKYAPGEDTEFWTRSLSIGYKAIKATEESTTHYRVHPDTQASATKKYIRIDQDKPWMRDGLYPFCAPLPKDIEPIVFSYHAPDISVIVPCGPNHSIYLQDAVDSIVGQTFRNWELLVVDDCGSDEESAFIKDVLKPYPFVRLLRHYSTGNKGAGASRNLGIDSSSGSYVLFLDVDDYLSPDALEKMAEVARNNPCRYVYSDWFSVDGKQSKRYETGEYNQSEWKMQHSVTVLMEKQHAQSIRFDDRMESWEDWDFFIRCAISGVCGVRLPEPMLFYRTDTGIRRMKIINGDGSPNELGARVLKDMKSRYEDYYNGRTLMSGCCGGNASNPIMDAKRRIEGAFNPTPAVNPADIVKMEYTGENIGSITYTVNGHHYRGGNNPINKFVTAPMGDAKELELLGKWRIVQSVQAAQVQTAKHEEEIKQTIATTLTQGQMQEMARKRLEEAKGRFVDDFSGASSTPTFSQANVVEEARKDFQPSVSEPHLDSPLRFDKEEQKPVKRGRGRPRKNQ